MIAYEFTEEERRITMLALAGFDITPDERATIRSLYMRMFSHAGGNPTLTVSTKDSRGAWITPGAGNGTVADELADHGFAPRALWKVTPDGKRVVVDELGRDPEHEQIASLINSAGGTDRRSILGDELRFKLHRWLNAAATAFREIVARDVADVKSTNDGAKRVDLVSPEVNAIVRERDSWKKQCGEALVEVGRISDLLKATRDEVAKIGGVAIMQVMEERRRQDRQWGGPDHDDAHAAKDWLRFIADHSDRARNAVNRKQQDWDEHRKQLVEIAALAVAAIEAHDRNHRSKPWSSATVTR